MDAEQIYAILQDGVTEFCASASPSMPASNFTNSPSNLHKHPGRELLFVLNGESLFSLNDRIYPLSRGSVVLINSWEAHSFKYNIGEEDLLHLWFYFGENHIYARLYRIHHPNQPTLTGEVFALPIYLNELFTARWNALEKHPPKSYKEYFLYLRSPMACILEELILMMRNKCGTVSGTPDIVEAIKVFIKSQVGCDCSLGHLGKVFGYDKFYLAHRFKQRTGISIGHYINQVRLSFTENAIQRGIMQKEIAYELGFSSPSAFGKWLKKTRNNRL